MRWSSRYGWYANRTRGIRRQAGGTVLFVLDALQLRGAVQPEELSRFDVGAAKAVAKNLLGAAALVSLWWACKRAARSAAQMRNARDE
jgi:hypothetical protein